MFDIGFAELLIVAILSLIILGPERLPEALRTMALWVGRFKRSYRQIRSEIEKEIGADDIKRQLYNEDILKSLKDSEQHLASLKNNTAMEIDALADPATSQKPSKAPAKPSE